MSLEDTRHWNLPERLHPVDLFVMIEVPAGTAFELDGSRYETEEVCVIRAKREAFLENRDQPRVYVCEDGAQFTGEFRWAYH